MGRVLLAVVAFSSLFLYATSAYKPVVFIHGILADGQQPTTMFKWINESHPGTLTYSIDLFNNLKSLTNLMEQVEEMKVVMRNFVQKHPEGFHLIGFSQGGVLSRGLLQQVEHNVDTFIGLASPLAGVFGIAKRIKPYFANLTRDNVYKLAYSSLGQKQISVFNYWNDPRHQDLYKQYSKYLAVLNNDTFNPHSEGWKNNFLRLKKLVLIGGPNDDLLIPWQSSLLGFYDKDLQVQDMTKQGFYIKDSFGLQTLHKRDAVVMHIKKNIKHHNFAFTKSVFDDCILPYLT